MGRNGWAAKVAAALAVLGIAGLRPGPTAGQATGLDKINHVIVIYQENWSFDSLYGRFPGADGIRNAGAALRQVDKNGQPYGTLPHPTDTTKQPVGRIRASPRGCRSRRSTWRRMCRRRNRRGTWSTGSISNSIRSTGGKWTSSSPGATRRAW